MEVEMGFRQDDGFTLLELSIVLVIVGLLAAGILVGSDLIAAARIRAEITRLTSYEVAFRTFKVKYDGIPGDFDKAGEIPNVPSGHYGNGDGLLDDTYNAEAILVWEHLSKAGLIEGAYSGTSYPRNPSYDPATDTCGADLCPPSTLGGHVSHFMNGLYSTWGYEGFQLYNTGYTLSDNNVGIITLSDNDVGNIREQGKLTVVQAQGIDAKADDGKADTGRVVTINAGFASDTCVSGDFGTVDGSANYRMQDGVDNCTLVYVLR
jgi:prepilin-type N-terminal cleavage/methylation domain-containing protein